MNNQEFEVVFNETIELCRGLMLNKNEEYARNSDKLHNFKQSGNFRNQRPEVALAGMMMKHTTSIYDYIDDHVNKKIHSLEDWDEKIIDHINYLILLRAILFETEEQKTIWRYRGSTEYYDFKQESWQSKKTDDMIERHRKEKML